jgi:HEAT repeat protein
VDILEGDADDYVSLDEILLKMVEEPPSIASNRSVYFLTLDEVDLLKKEVETEVDPTFVFNIIDILFEILALEKEQEPYQDAANILIKVLDALLTLGDFQKASDVLKRVYIVLKTYDLKDWQMETLQKLIADVGEEHRVERIGRVLEREEGIRPEDVNGYLVLLQKNAVKPLIKLLGELKNSKTRRILCDALAEIGKNAIELIVPSIDDRRWFLVRNIVYVLGRIGKEQSLPYLQKISNHEDLRVRREVVQALGLIGGPKAIGLLGKALTDDDVRIRSTAAINLGKIGKSAGLGPLLEVVQLKDFQKKEPVEIKAFFDAIGMVGSNEAIPILQQLLERKSWFARGKLDEIRVGAANALAMIHTSEARAVLESGKSSKDDTLREVCMRAMRNYPA